MENYSEYTIQKILNYIQANGLPMSDVDNLSLENGKTYNLLASGDTHGIFQLQRSGERYYLKLARLNSFSDLMAFLALNRNGTIENDMMWDFIDNKNGTNHFDYADRKNPRKNIDYIVPVLEPILRGTYGLIIYREQIYEILSKVACFKREQGELFHKNIVKKVPEIIQRDKLKFYESARKNGIPVRKIDEIYEIIKYSSGFVIRKELMEKEAHLVYQMAYLKAHYPKEFMASVKFKNSDE